MTTLKAETPTNQQVKSKQRVADHGRSVYQPTRSKCHVRPCKTRNRTY